MLFMLLNKTIIYTLLYKHGRNSAWIQMEINTFLWNIKPFHNAYMVQLSHNFTKYTIFFLMSLHILLPQRFAFYHFYYAIFMLKILQGVFSFYKFKHVGIWCCLFWPLLWHIDGAVLQQTRNKNKTTKWMSKYSFNDNSRNIVVILHQIDY